MFLEFELMSASPSSPDLRNLVSQCQREEYPYRHFQKYALIGT